MCSHRRSSTLSVQESHSMKVFCKTPVASLDSKERHCILSWFLTHFSPVFLYILPCFFSRLKRENVSLEFHDFPQGDFFQNLNGDRKTTLWKFGTMFCKEWLKTFLFYTENNVLCQVCIFCKCIIKFKYDITYSSLLTFPNHHKIQIYF